MKKALPIIVAIIFMFAVIAYVLVIRNGSPVLAFLIAFIGALIIKFGGDALIENFEHLDFVDSIWFPVITIGVCVILSSSLFIRSCTKMEVGYKAGNHSNHKCAFCGSAADGGAFVSEGEPSSYYCKEHFEQVKKYESQKCRNCGRKGVTGSSGYCHNCNEGFYEWQEDRNIND